MTFKNATLAIAASTLMAASGASAQEAIRIGTSSVGSIFYTLAIGAGEIIHKHAGLNATIEPVGGSTASVNALGAKKIEFAMANSFASSSAFYGKYRFKKKIAIRMLINGQPNYRSLFVRKSAKIKTAQDLVGKIVIGKRRALPENELVMRAMMKVMGLGDDSVRLVATTNSPQMYKALAAGSVDGAIVPYSPRAAAITKVLQDDVVEPFYLSKQHRDEAMKYVPTAFYAQTFKPGSLTKQDKPMHVFGLSTYLITRPDVSDELAYRVTKAILDNTKEFATYSRAARLWNTKRTVTDPKLPFHPGAIKYFKEKGVWTAELEATQKKLLQ